MDARKSASFLFQEIPNFRPKVWPKKSKLSPEIWYTGYFEYVEFNGDVYYFLF